MTRKTQGGADGLGVSVAGPSANFLLVGLIVSGLGFCLGGGLLEGAGAGFVFVMAGWVLCQCVHEFGHAVVAGRGGSMQGEVADTLGLDPRRLPDPVSSLALPLLFTILSGIGFPGGRISFDPSALRSKGWQSAMAAAGPAATLACLLGFALLYGLADEGAESASLRAVLAVSALFQGTALVLGLMPVPGLDGYAILRPWLPEGWLWMDRIAAHPSLVLTGLFLVSGGFALLLFRAGLRLTMLAGIAPADVIAGYQLIRLW